MSSPEEPPTCKICQEVTELPIYQPCQHIYACTLCTTTLFELDTRCPECRTEITSHGDIQVENPRRHRVPEDAPPMQHRTDTIICQFCDQNIDQYDISVAECSQHAPHAWHEHCVANGVCPLCAWDDITQQPEPPAPTSPMHVPLLPPHAPHLPTAPPAPVSPALPSASDAALEESPSPPASGPPPAHAPVVASSSVQRCYVASCASPQGPYQTVAQLGKHLRKNHKARFHAGIQEDETKFLATLGLAICKSCDLPWCISGCHFNSCKEGRNNASPLQDL